MPTNREHRISIDENIMRNFETTIPATIGGLKESLEKTKAKLEFLEFSFYHYKHASKRLRENEKEELSRENERTTEQTI